jgi:hypothetical protein
MCSKRLTVRRAGFKLCSFFNYHYCVALHKEEDSQITRQAGSDLALYYTAAAAQSASACAPAGTYTFPATRWAAPHTSCVVHVVTLPF